ncbi:MAG TPA: grasp-with-spasm system ATP-grasp peptide maturase [Edaphocola sp.]|nr:grasp-with-spasm system ATP-grasp peptide maturase [Edaphocola sp.]
MIVIFGKQRDYSTILLIQWLNNLKKQFFRINSISNFEELNVNTNTCSILSDNKARILCNEICSVYFHGGDFSLNLYEIEDIDLRNQLKEYIKDEVGILFQDIFDQIKTTKKIGNDPFLQKTLNKLSTLKLAKKNGLYIPKSKIVTTREQIIKTKNEWGGRVVNKSIGDGVSIHTSNLIINGQRTIELFDKDILNLNDVFLPSLIQELIIKKYEIRAFYFRQRFYSIAIFSQNLHNTKIDYRGFPTNYLRIVPYCLPNDIENKLMKLMKDLNLNSGSIDLIYTKNNQYYFLEVNPHGQFGFLSYLGNYHIEKEMAEYL